MFKRELTNLEERLYDFLDFADGILEYDVSQKSWEKLREAMKRCKEDCKVKYGVINNGYSLHVELPFDVDKYMKQQEKKSSLLQDMKEDPAAKFTDYNYLKKLCNNEVYQFKRPDKKEVNGAHWIFSEEYALNHDGFELFWHTPGVRDGGEYVVAKFPKNGTKDTLVVEAHKDGFVPMGVIKRTEIKLERGKNRMIRLYYGEMTSEFKVYVVDEQNKSN